MNHKTLPANDNYEWRSLYQNEPELLEHIPKARYLIERYGAFFEKNLINHFDFVFLEKALCDYLAFDAQSSAGHEMRTKWIARRLHLNPMILYNDAGFSLN